MNAAKNLIKGVKRAVDAVTGKNKGNVWDMSTKEAREIQVKRDFENAKIYKDPVIKKFIQLDDYYNNKPWSKDKLKEIAKKMNWSYIPPAIPDAYIQVESQIDPDLPSFQFNPTDEYSTQKAKERESIVEAIIYENKVQDMIPDNERTLNKLGDAFFKVSFDGKILKNKMLGKNGYVGKVIIGNPDPANIFPDPSAYDIDDCEYIDYAYRVSRRQARREFGEIVDDISNDNNHSDTEIYARDQEPLVTGDDSMQVVEHWYKDNEGDIACSIQINNVEVKHIPKYWEDTRNSGNQMYPFIKYCKTPVNKSFWDKGEIEPIIELIDVVNKITDTTILNFEFCANDIILTETGVFSEDEPPKSIPGAIWETRPGKSGNVKRLGGVTNSTDALNLIKYFTQKIQETNGNFDVTMGQAPPANVTTFSGMAILNEQGNKRQNLKKYDRKNGFRRLFELVDWTALEFLNVDTKIMIKNPDDPQGPRVPKTFNSTQHKVLDSSVTDEMQEPSYIYPKVDIEIQVGEGIKQSKAITLSATDQIAKTPITPGNAELIKAEVEIMDLPNKDLINESIDKQVAMLMPPQQAQEPQFNQEDVNMILNKLTPEQQQVFFNSSEEEQAQYIGEEIQTLKGGGG